MAGQSSVTQSCRQETERVQGQSGEVMEDQQTQMQTEKGEETRDQQRLQFHPREIQESEASSKSDQAWQRPGLSVIRGKKADTHMQKDGIGPPIYTPYM